MVGAGAIIGPLLSVISSIISTFGVSLQKVAHTENEAREKKDQVDYVKMPKPRKSTQNQPKTKKINRKPRKSTENEPKIKKINRKPRKSI